MKKIGVIVDKLNTFMFKRLKKAIELKIIAVEGVEQMDILLKEDTLNVQLVQELRQ